MKKNVDNRTVEPEDMPDFEVSTSIFELTEILEQRLENKPRGTNSLAQWRKDVNRSIEEINTILGFNKYKKV